MKGALRTAKGQDQDVGVGNIKKMIGIGNRR